MDETTHVNFQTTDLSLAAFLIARGHPLLQLGGYTHHRVFEFPAAARADAPGFFLNGQVGARDFASALRQLKAAIHTV